MDNSNKLKMKDAEKARDSITASQKKEIAKLYEKWADEIKAKAEVYKHKTTPSSVVSEKQMKELEKMLRSTSEKVANEVYKKIKENIYKVSSSVIESDKEWLKSLGFYFGDEGFDALFNNVPDNIVKKLVAGQIYNSGWSLSKAIWGDNEATISHLYEIVAGGVAKNQSIYEIAKDIEKVVRPSAKKPWNLTDKDGRKIYPRKVDYSAQRLARTLVQHGYQQSFTETTKDNPFITEYKWNSNGSRVCEICKARDGKHFKKDELPLDHPNGMCTMEPVVSNTLVDDIANWYKAPKGKYPDIDKFAKKLGYEFKEQKKKVKVAEFTNIQKQMLEKYGYTPDNIPSYDKWFDECSISDFEKICKLSTNKLMSVKDYYNKYVGKVKYKYKETIENQYEESLSRSIKKMFDSDEWRGFFKKQTEQIMLEKEKASFDLMSRDNIDGLIEYTGSSYGKMNKYLRELAKGLSEEDAILRSKISSGQLNHMKNAIEGLNKVHTDEDLILRRGSDLGELAGLMSGNFDKNKELLYSMSVKELNEKFAGTIGDIAGFTSTSSLYERGFDGDVEVIYYAPKGISASSIMSISQFGTDEGETLLNAGTKVKVIKVEKSDGHKSSNIRIFMEILK